jgi:hypothetical protein
MRAPFWKTTTLQFMLLFLSICTCSFMQNRVLCFRCAFSEDVSEPVLAINIAEW